MLTFLSAPKNKECIKAQKFLDTHGIPYVYRDIIKQRPSTAELTRWMELSKMPLRAFYHNGFSIFSAVALGERLAMMNDNTRLAYIAASGRLVRHPLLVGDDFILIGFHEAEWDNKLKGSIWEKIPD